MSTKVNERLMLPVTLDVRGRPCLVVGGGEVAARKVQRLVEAGAAVTVVAPEVVPGLEAAAAAGELRWERRPYRPDEAGQHFFTVAATNDRAVNEQVSRDAAGAGRLVNVVDAPDLSNVFSPAVVRRGGLQVAVSTSGAFPALARKLREDIEQWLPPSYGRLLERLRKFRGELRTAVTDPASRKAIIGRVVRSPETGAFLKGDEAPLDALLAGAVTGAARPGEFETPAMRFLVVGVDHESAPVNVRERLAFSEAECRAELDALMGRPGVAEAMLLSTCNRTELYVRHAPGADPGETADALIRELIRARGADGPAPDVFYRKYNGDAARHLCRVAAGLESMIRGETEILGQVKRAYSMACEADACSAFMHKLLHAAFRVGKRARSETGIGAGTISVSRAVVDLAQKRLGNLRGKTVLVVGAGKIASRAAACCRDSGIASLLIVNRTESAARELAERLSGGVRPFAQLAAALAEADVAVVSTAAPACVVTADMVREAVAGRPGRSLLLIDTGVPRNVEPAAREVPGVFLEDIDSLREVVDRNAARRNGHIRRVERIIDGEMAVFEGRLPSLEVAPVIRGMINFIEDVRRQEIDRFARHFTPEQLGLLDQLTRGLARKLLHRALAVVLTKDAQ